MDKLEAIKDWLENFHWWRDAQWGIDLSGCIPISCSLTLEDERAVSRKERVTGSSVLRVQTQFSFMRVSYGEDDTNLWLSEFALWLRWQSEEDQAPCFGEGRTLYHLEKAKLETLGDKTVYTVKIIATYDELYDI